MIESSTVIHSNRKLSVATKGLPVVAVVAVDFTRLGRRFQPTKLAGKRPSYLAERSKGEKRGVRTISRDYSKKA